jgi:hypothetical protein
LADGYWGRDHGDNSGNPSDNFKRTTFGVYPAGGNFDDDRFEHVSSGDSSGGAGITPILTAAWVDFLKAEIALSQGNTGNAKAHLSNGLAKQITKVSTFSSRDPEAAKSPHFLATAADINAFITSVRDDFDDAPWDTLGVQFFVSAFGNGIESYNFYRRTGYPTSLQPSLSKTPGIFIRSMFYPANAANTNSNISQKPNQAQPVFWDTNATGPVAN